ncbi:glycosyltransferase family 2 protein [Deltaproteobacteria bacterium TL4]
MRLAPIALFTYNRPWHVRQTLAALAQNHLASQSELFVFADAPADQSSVEKVQEVRKLIKNAEGFKNITLNERPHNFGLAKNIIEGVSTVLKEHDRIIVVEDDIVTSSFFLRYMNEALELYQHEERVASIHGYVYPVQRPLPETFFLRGADCWGWATWARAWSSFEPEGKQLVRALEDSGLKNKFDYNGTFRFYHMLKKQSQGKNESWAIRWHASCFLKNKLTLYPGQSLVHNIGYDGSGIHSDQKTAYATELSEVSLTLTPIKIEENNEAWKAFEQYFRTINPAWKRFLSSLVRLFQNQ